MIDRTISREATSVTKRSANFGDLPRRDPTAAEVGGTSGLRIRSKSPLLWILWQRLFLDAFLWPGRFLITLRHLRVLSDMLVHPGVGSLQIAEILARDPIQIDAEVCILGLTGADGQRRVGYPTTMYLWAGKGRTEC
jgi:hypothetical protein